MVTIKRKNKNQLIWGSNSLVINKNLVLMYVYSFIIIS